MQENKVIAINPPHEGIFDNIKKIFFENLVTLMFVVLCIAGIALSGQPLAFIVNELIARLTRNSFLVLSLIIPVLAGMGLNFGIVLGAMAGQIALIAVTHFKVGGLSGFMLAIALSTPIAILFGYLTAKLLNKTKGQEMISGMILGFFANGLYQLLFLFLVGTIIPIKNPIIVLSSGVGIKNTLDLSGPIGTKYALDNIFKLPFIKLALIFAVLGLVFYVYRYFKSRSDERLRENQSSYIVNAFLFFILTGTLTYISMTKSLLNVIVVPFFTILAIVLLCIFNVFILKTKLGQDFRSVGQDMNVARISGIHVNRVRITAILISTILAAWGQLIFLQL